MQIFYFFSIFRRLFYALIFFFVENWCPAKNLNSLKKSLDALIFNRSPRSTCRRSSVRREALDPWFHRPRMGWCDRLARMGGWIADVSESVVELRRSWVRLLKSQGYECHFMSYFDYSCNFQNFATFFVKW